MSLFCLLFVGRAVRVTVGLIGKFKMLTATMFFPPGLAPVRAVRLSNFPRSANLCVGLRQNVEYLYVI